MNKIKVFLFGLLNYLIRFAVGGALYMGLKMDAEGLAFPAFDFAFQRRERGKILRCLC